MTSRGVMIPLQGGPPCDLLGIGFGPSNLAVAAAIASQPAEQWVGKRISFLERSPTFSWHQDMLLEGARMQIAFLKDLVTQTNPTSPYSFVNYLFERGRIEDFLNLRTMYPTRIECHDYFSWAAEKLRRYVRYGCEVTAIRPHRAAGETIDLLEVSYRDRETLEERVELAKNVVLSVGGQPTLPACVSPSMLDGRVFHNAQFLSRIAPFAAAGKDRPYRFLVVGGGQSAAEVFQYLAREFPAASIVLAVRRFCLMPANSSPHANEIFNPEMVNFFFDLPDERKRDLLHNLHHTNYSAVDEEVISSIFNLIYDQKVQATQRLRLLRLKELIRCERQGDTVIASLKCLATGETLTDSYDGVVLTTGYDFRHSERLLSELGRHLVFTESGAPSIRRDYSIETVPALRARIYLQGATEHTHGLTSTLLSVLPYRARDILTSTFGAQPQIDAAVGSLGK